MTKFVSNRECDIGVMQVPVCFCVFVLFVVGWLAGARGLDY